jgi:hypothetical protein
MSKPLALVLACVALPALAQTTTTVTSQPQQQAAPPPPPPPTTTVTTQTPPPPPSTQVVVNPSDPNAPPPPPPRTTVRADDDVGVVAAPSGRSAVAIIATDAIYGGVAGAVIGGGITLINQGDHWARNIMVGAGIGILAGSAYGVYESATQTPERRAVAVADPGASNVNGPAFTALAGRF